MKENYRPVSLLPHVSKVFDRIIYKEINTCMEDKLSKYLTGFRNSHGTQHLLVTMIEKWKKAVNNGEYVSALFLDLLKAFGRINHELLLAKLKAYGFSSNALKLMHSDLKNRKQQVQINNKFSSESTVIAEIKGSLCFLDVKIFRENDKFVTSVFRKEKFSGVYTNFIRFIPLEYKFGLVHTLLSSCFNSSSDFLKFHHEVDKLKEILSKNVYAQKFY